MLNLREGQEKMDSPEVNAGNPSDFKKIYDECKTKTPAHSGAAKLL